MYQVIAEYMQDVSCSFLVVLRHWRVQNFAHIPRGREWFKKAWVFSGIPWIGTCYNQHSLPRTSSTGTSCLKKKKNHPRIQRDNIYCILCFNMHVSAISNPCDESCESLLNFHCRSAKGKRWPWGCRRILRRSSRYRGKRTQKSSNLTWRTCRLFRSMTQNVSFFSYF